MSNKSANIAGTASKPSKPSVFSRRRTKTASQDVTSEAIAADIAAFKKRGGRIEVLGTSAYRAHLASSTYRSNVKSESKATTEADTKNTERGCHKRTANPAR